MAAGYAFERRNPPTEKFEFLAIHDYVLPCQYLLRDSIIQMVGRGSIFTCTGSCVRQQSSAQLFALANDCRQAFERLDTQLLIDIQATKYNLDIRFCDAELVL